MQDTTARVLSCEPLAQELVRLILSAPEIAAQAKAGQFIHMLVPDSGHVLRRPISLMAVDAAAGTATMGGEIVEDGLEGDWPVLQPGANAVSWSGSVTAVSITVNPFDIGA